MLKRTFDIELENRTYDIEVENRTYDIELENRTLLVKAGRKIMKRIPKDPDAQLNYSFDYSDWLETGDLIASYLLIDSTDITIESQSNTDTVVTAVISGGIANAEETLTCRVTTTNGLIDDRTIILEMGDR